MFKEFNRTHLEHTLYALGMMALVGYFTSWDVGAAFGSAFFIGREHAQAEMRVSPRERLPELKCLTKWEYWGWDSILDFLCPLVITVTLALGLSFL